MDAGYEGKSSIVLIEAKNTSASNTIIRQLYYPYRQWQINTNKEVFPVFFEKRVIDGKNIFIFGNIPLKIVKNTIVLN